MDAQIGIEKKDRSEVAGILNRALADEYVLLVKTKNYHWNVVGPDFSELHKFFDGQYEQISEFVDDVAERVRSLDGKSRATLAEFIKQSALKEQPGDYPPAVRMIENLLKDHEQIVRKLRKDLEDCSEKYGDMGTSDFLTGLMEEHEKLAWMLRSYLE